MQNDTTQFVVNIIPLQNIQTNISGLDPISVLSNDLANIQQMVDFQNKTVYTDFLRSFTENGSINVLSPLNLSNTILTSNGSEITTGSSSPSSNLVNSNTSITLSGSNILFLVNSSNSLTLTSNSGTFPGTVYAQNFVTLSDKGSKSNIQMIEENILDKLTSLNTYRFNYSNSPDVSIGLLAQEVEELFPEAIQRGVKGEKYVNYNSVLSLMIKAIMELKDSIKLK
jgi:hypothetical protein